MTSLFCINIDDNVFDCVFDNDGYFYLCDNHDVVYEFSIEHMRCYYLNIYKLECHDNFQYVIEPHKTQNKLELYTTIPTLQNRVAKEVISTFDENELEDELNIDNTLVFYPEDYEFKQIKKSHNEFEFYGNVDLRRLMEYNNTHMNIQMPAPYDTFVYDKSNTLTYVARNIDINTSHRLLIYQNGTVKLKTVGYPDIEYKLMFNDNVMSCMVC